METKQIVLSRLLPKTGQKAPFRTGDDATFQAGWWKGLSVDGNRDRFIAKTIGIDDVVIDLATGLMWAAADSQAGCNSGVALNWNNAIDYALALDFVGFTDWRVPNINELLSLFNYATSAPAAYLIPFSGTQSVKYWSSTTHHYFTDDAWYADFENGISYRGLKGDLRYLRCVRSGI